MRLLLALLFGTTLLLAAPVPKEKKKVDDAEAILGKWEFDKIDIGKNDPRAAESLKPRMDLQVRVSFFLTLVIVLYHKLLLRR